MILLRYKRKQYLEGDYMGYNLVFCLDNGDPTETHLIEKWFKKWQAKSILALPHILFRELRHSSTTFKLKESDDDYKSVIGDTGHATPDIAIRVYGQLVDKNRQALPSKLEDRLYQKEISKNNVSAAETEGGEVDVSALERILSTIKDKDPLLHKKVLQAVLAFQE